MNSDFWAVIGFIFLLLLSGWLGYQAATGITSTERGETITKLQAVQWCVLNVADSAVRMGADPYLVAEQLPLIAEDCSQNLEEFLGKLEAGDYD